MAWEHGCTRDRWAVDHHLRCLPVASVIEGTGIVMFYFKASSNISDRWRAWTDDADENMKDSLVFAGLTHTEAKSYSCSTAPQPLVSIKMRIDDLGDSSVQNEWMATKLQQQDSCTIEITHTAAEVGDVYGGTFEAVLKNVSNGASKAIAGNFRRILQ